MKRFYFTLSLLAIVSLTTLKATHIVGGEIQVRHAANSNYDFILNLYFDQINGQPGARDQSIRLSIYAKGTNVFMDSLRLPIVQEQNVLYTNPACTSSQLATLLLRYQLGFTLASNRYNNPAGYYVIWERCCRNNIISNIVSPNLAGMTFYTEIPAVIRNGSPFLNSSPAFTIPKGDYLCKGRQVSIDFSATDTDGDQLVYSLVTPLAGHSRSTPNTLIVPPPFPAPYELVTWATGYTANTAIPHNPAFPAHQLTINSQGIMTVTPSKLGLYVLSVLVEEYRSGVKIGEVERDFQFLVLDCPTNESPSIAVQTGTDNSGNAVFYQNGQIVQVQSPDNLCVNIWLKDPDAPERLSVRVVGTNFTPRANFLSSSSGTVPTVNDSLKIAFCWDKCLYSAKDALGNYIPFEFDLIVSDDGCPASKNDTIHIKLIAPPVLNSPPVVSTTAGIVSEETHDYYMERKVGETFSFDVIGQDLIDASQTIELSAQGQGFDLAKYNMVFVSKTGKGTLESPFEWQTTCDAVKEERTEYLIDFITRDQGLCERKADTATVKLVLIDPDVVLEEFLPANAFTPDGDTQRKNEYFSMPDLPEENCRYQFIKIEIFNRWGGKVYESADRNFEWNGSDLPASTYYYRIDFKKKIYKGTVSILK